MIDRFDDEALLDRFRRWLHDARTEAEDLARAGEGPAPPDAEVREVGLYQMVEEFTALRHEIKLQTKGTRGLQEQAEALLPAMGQAIEQFRAVAAKEAQAAWSAGRPLAEALADLDEALDRGRTEVEKARLRIASGLTRTEAALDATFAALRWPRRRLVRSYHERIKQALRDQSTEVRRAILDSLAEGYGLIQARLRRALKAEGVHRIDCVGKPVDPECMAVAEAVDDLDHPPGHVVAEVRRGYTWKGRVLRLAEVRAVRTPPLPLELESR